MSIANSAFSNCWGLTSIDIPNSVTCIGDNAFCYCSGLTSVAIPNSVSSIGDKVFYGCSNLTSITIPNSVSSIGKLSFGHCSSITSIIIPNEEMTIGDWAFDYCSGLTSIISLNITPPTCEYSNYGYTQFYSVDKENCVVWVPRGSVNAYKWANGWKDFRNIRELIPGDANVDGMVNAADVVEVLNAIDGKPSDRFLLYNADRDGSGSLTEADITAIANIIMTKK